MGAKEMNFHFEVFARMGYEEAATKIQDAYLDGRKDDAAAAVPTALVEEIALVGPVEKIRDDLEAWRESRATTMLVNGDARHLAHHGRTGARLDIRLGWTAALRLTRVFQSRRFPMCPEVATGRERR